MPETLTPTAPATAKSRRTGSFPTAAHARRYTATLVVLAVLAAAIALGILVWDNPAPAGSDGFWRIAQLRVSSVVVIVIVAICQSLATITFQTVTANRIVTPSLVGQFVLLIKDSSVVSAIGLLDLTRAGWMIVQSVPQGLMVFGTVGLGYFLICYPLIHLSRRLERRGQDALL